MGLSLASRAGEHLVRLPEYVAHVGNVLETGAYKDDGWGVPVPSGRVEKDQAAGTARHKLDERGDEPAIGRMTIARRFVSAWRVARCK